MEVENLAPNGPYPKQAIFSMAQGLAAVNGNPYEFFAQYRGSPGNPDNCVTFKAVMAGPALEFNSGERAQAVMSLNPGTTYFWRATWNATSFRLVVREGGVSGRVIYDRDRLGGNNYSPEPARRLPRHQLGRRVLHGNDRPQRLAERQPAPGVTRQRDGAAVTPEAAQGPEAQGSRLRA